MAGNSELQVGFEINPHQPLKQEQKIHFKLILQRDQFMTDYSQRIRKSISVVI
jgi:hypothetical protein